MVEKISQSRLPGTDIVRCGPNRTDSGVRSALLLATDIAVGAASQVTRLAVRASETGMNAGIAAGRVVSTLPGANGAGQLVSTATRPLVDTGRETRARARSSAQIAVQRLLEALVPELLETLDIDALVRRIDIDRLVQRIEIEGLVGRIDIDALVQRIDLDAVVARIDVNQIAERIDIDAVVEQTELGTIVARSTSGFASEALDSARSQAADIDTLVSRVVNRVLRRRESDMPTGPSPLTGETHTVSEPGTVRTSADASDRGSK